MEKFALITVLGIQGRTTAMRRGWPMTTGGSSGPFAFGAAPLEAAGAASLPGFMRHVATVTVDGSHLRVDPVVDDMPEAAAAVAPELAAVVAEWGWDQSAQVDKALASFDALPLTDPVGRVRAKELELAQYAAVCGREDLVSRIRQRAGAHPGYQTLVDAVDNPCDEARIRELAWLPGPWAMLAMKVLPPASLTLMQVELIERGRDNAARAGAGPH